MINCPAKRSRTFNTWEMQQYKVTMSWKTVAVSLEKKPNQTGLQSSIHPTAYTCEMTHTEWPTSTYIDTYRLCAGCITWTDWDRFTSTGNSAPAQHPVQVSVSTLTVDVDRTASSAHIKCWFSCSSSRGDTWDAPLEGRRFLHCIFLVQKNRSPSQRFL